MKTKTTISKITALLLCLALLVGMTPLTAFAEDTLPLGTSQPTTPAAAPLGLSITPFASGSVDITGKTVAEAQTAIDAAINAVVSGDTVTVTGNITGATTTMTLNIPSGVTVVWKATLSGQTATGAMGNGYCLIFLTGAGTFEVANGGEISATGPSSTVVNSNNAASKIKVSGGKVTTISSDSIYAKGEVEVSGGEVTNTSTDAASTAIVGQSAITISGGKVSSNRGNAIYANGINTVVTVSGGEVTVGADANSAIASNRADVTISGGIVKSSASKPTIYCTNNGKITVTGGTILATGSALRADGATAEINITGGTVYGQTSTLTGSGALIYLKDNAGGYTPVSTPGVAIMRTGNTTAHIAGTNAEIVVSPPMGATAVWEISGSDSGIYYINGANVGFIPVAGVTVTGSTKTTLAASDLNYSIPAGHTYTGSPQGIGAVTMNAPHDTNFNATTGGTFAIHYSSSAVVPTNTGTYAVTAEISGGVMYEAVSIPLGSYTIGKAMPVVVPTVTGTISYGQPLSTLALSTTAAGTIAWDTPTSKPAVGAPPQSWTFTPTDTTNYEVVAGSSAITVSKTTPTGTPTSTAITQAGKTLADAGLTGSFTNQYDSSAIAGQLVWDLGNAQSVQADTAYGWTFTPTDTANYNTVTTGTIMPYVTIPVASVALNKTTLPLSIGGTETLVETVLPANAANKAVTWASSNLAVVTVSNGVVTGVSAGTAIITVTTADGGFTANCVVTVTAAPPTIISVSGVNLDKAALTIVAGGTAETLTASVLPANAANKAITWSSDNSAVATVSNGVVTGVSAGTATITVTSTDGSKTATCSVTVLQAGTVIVPVTGVVVAPKTANLVVGGTTKLNVAIEPIGATIKDIAWTSSNPAVATVDGNGNVTAVAAGSATITATNDHSGLSDSAVITVTALPVNPPTTSGGGGSSSGSGGGGGGKQGNRIKNLIERRNQVKNQVIQIAQVKNITIELFLET